MWPQNQPSPSSLPPSLPTPSRQNKVTSQREYREREGDSFNKLRDVIRIHTGEEPRTRQEILKKAIDLLSTSRIENHRESLASTLTACEAPACETPVSTMELEDTILDQLSHSAQTSQWTQTWQPNARFHVAAPPYDTHFGDNQQYHSIPTTDRTFSHFSSRGSGGDSFNYRQSGGPF